MKSFSLFTILATFAILSVSTNVSTYALKETVQKHNERSNLRTSSLNTLSLPTSSAEGSRKLEDLYEYGGPVAMFFRVIGIVILSPLHIAIKTIGCIGPFIDYTYQNFVWSLEFLCTVRTALAGAVTGTD
eukprot:CAMPEP_0178956812 /NCGR_PEP_ID=MMETSP0789-20121207/10500_1 /TAXON_ID=3005 /ORGANISM="Rhizosolenia setigera, Strain CCMP 1694" /LENGTH=129 /DNA_ID=CAMNT_0020638859 /DNA_START=44 /DNA_END=433 /DNA_ORIENTATION=-